MRARNPNVEIRNPKQTQVTQGPNALNVKTLLFRFALGLLIGALIGAVFLRIQAKREHRQSVRELGRTLARDDLARGTPVFYWPADAPRNVLDLVESRLGEHGMQLKLYGDAIRYSEDRFYEGYNEVIQEELQRRTDRDTIEELRKECEELVVRGPDK